jgi:hypothetical protein
MESLVSIADLMLIVQAFCCLGVLVAQKPKTGSLWLLFESVATFILQGLSFGLNSETFLTSILLIFFSLALIGINIYFEASLSTPPASASKINIISGLILIGIFLFNIKSVLQFIDENMIQKEISIRQDFHSLVSISFTFLCILTCAVIIINNKHFSHGKRS